MEELMESIWQKNIKMPSFPQLKGDKKADVLIIGGGMAGLLTAYYLRQSGVDCILVEKERICHGTTAGTTAKITFQHGLIYHKLLKKGGTEMAQSYLQANRIAFDEYGGLCSNIDCDYERKDNFVYSLDDGKALENEMNALEKIGYRAQLCRTLPLPFPTVGGVKFPGQAQFHPLKFAAAIAENLPVYENTWVRELKGDRAVTDTGTITAEQIVVTTHFPFINTHGSYFLKLYQHRSYVLALKNAQDVNGMYVSDSKTGLSFRNYKDFMLLGGGAHRTGKRSGNREQLRSFANRYYPDSREYCCWAAQDCMSLDEVPYIGKYSSRTSQLYTATGFNKWGMTGTMLSALLLRDRILGKTNDFSETFSPSRSILKPQLFVNGLEAVKNLLTISNKRCPHLGCALKWNRAEHSWDCACHGSRFDEDGKLLNNPANGDLK